MSRSVQAHRRRMWVRQAMGKLRRQRQQEQEQGQ